jgi:DNA-binding transcriptional MerR regulator
MRVGELSKLIGVPDRELRRLAKIGVIPAKRLPSKRAHWRFAKIDIPKIRATLIGAGIIEEPVRKK